MLLTSTGIHATTAYAHYFTGKVNGTKVHLITISKTMQPIGDTYKVESKAAAKALAKQHNAKPWNF